VQIDALPQPQAHKQRLFGPVWWRDGGLLHNTMAIAGKRRQPVLRLAMSLRGGVAAAPVRSGADT
jgi:hypothetical protein